METGVLKIFHAVAETGKVSLAARQLNCVQSNVTVRLKNLENELGTRLFHRMSKGMALTPAGRTLYAYSQKILNLLNESMVAVKNDQDPKGPLSLGAFESSTAYWLPAVMADFHSAFPHVELSLKINTEEALLDNLLRYELDGVFITFEVFHNDIEQVVAFRDELVLVTPRDIPDPLQMENPTQLVFPRPCAFRDRLELWLKHHKMAAGRSIELGSVNGIIGCVAAGMGLSMILRSSAQRAGRAGEITVHELPKDVAALPIYFLYRKESVENRRLQALLDFF
jgi:DNA-binding transcriptional LysR family regulator